MYKRQLHDRNFNNDNLTECGRGVLASSRQDLVDEHRLEAAGQVLDRLLVAKVAKRRVGALEGDADEHVEELVEDQLLIHLRLRAVILTGDLLLLEEDVVWPFQVDLVSGLRNITEGIVERDSSDETELRRFAQRHLGPEDQG